MADTKFRFGEVKRAYAQMKIQLPIDLANQAQVFFVSTWRAQGWEGVPWELPQRRIEGTKEYKYPKNKGLGRRTRATLVEVGTLRRAVSNSIRTATFSLIRLVVDLAYAAIHNDGGLMKNGKPMPKRRFMGDNRDLRVMQKEKINTYLSKIFRK